MRIFLLMMMWTGFICLSGGQCLAQTLDAATTFPIPNLPSDQATAFHGRSGLATVDAIVARGSSVEDLTERIPETKAYAERNNISFSLNALVDNRSDEEIAYDTRLGLQKLEMSRREFPINLLFLFVRTGAVAHAYFTYFPDSTAGWQMAAAFVALTSNVIFFRPDTWHNMQMFTMEKIYRTFTKYDFNNRNEHPHLNLGIRLGMNIIYGSIFSSIVSPMLHSQASSWWVILGGIVPSAVINEVVDHWTFGVQESDRLMNRDSQRTVNFARQMLFSSLIIPLIQAGNGDLAIASGIVGIGAAVAYTQAPRMLYLTGGFWEPLMMGLKMTRTYEFLTPRIQNATTKLLDWYVKFAEAANTRHHLWRSSFSCMGTMTGS